MSIMNTVNDTTLNLAQSHHFTRWLMRNQRLMHSSQLDVSNEMMTELIGLGYSPEDSELICKQMFNEMVQKTKDKKVAMYLEFLKSEMELDEWLDWLRRWREFDPEHEDEQIYMSIFLLWFLLKMFDNKLVLDISKDIKNNTNNNNNI